MGGVIPGDVFFSLNKDKNFFPICQVFCEKIFIFFAVRMGLEPIQVLLLFTPSFSYYQAFYEVASRVKLFYLNGV